MKKYKTEARDYDALRPGDPLLLSFGVLPLVSVEAVSGRRLTFDAGAGGTHVETRNADCAPPPLVLGFTDEYAEAHPLERFDASPASPLVDAIGVDEALELYHAVAVSAVGRIDAMRILSSRGTPAANEKLRLLVVDYVAERGRIEDRIAMLNAKMSAAGLGLLARGSVVLLGMDSVFDVEVKGPAGPTAEDNP